MAPKKKQLALTNFFKVKANPEKKKEVKAPSKVMPSQQVRKRKKVEKEEHPLEPVKQKKRLNTRKAKKNYKFQEQDEDDLPSDPESEDGYDPTHEAMVDEEEDVDFLVDENQVKEEEENMEDDAMMKNDDRVVDPEGNPYQQFDIDNANPVNEQRRRKFERALSVSSKNNASKQGEIRLQDTNVKETPLVKQVQALQEKYPDILLAVEVGYKYTFYRNDARIASKALGMVAYVKKDGFLQCTFPTHRLEHYIKRLVNAGLKVGVVTQKETAAVKKKSGSKTKVFVRELEQVYTKATHLGEQKEKPSDALPAPPTVKPIAPSRSNFKKSDSFIMCLHEHQNVISLIAIEATTGLIVYDQFTEPTGFMRRELHSRLNYFQPVEMLLPSKGSLSTQTMGVIQSFSSILRIERCKFEAQPIHFTNVDFSDMSSALLLCLNAAHAYLQKFEMDTLFKFAKPIHYRKSIRQHLHMTLNASTIHNLELLRNHSDGNIKGSLFWLMNFTKTAFGSRLLQRWICNPLVRRESIEERLDAVTEIIDAPHEELSSMHRLFFNLPDLERCFMRILYGRSKPNEFVSTLLSLKNLYCRLKPILAVPVQSTYLKRIFQQLPQDLEEHVLACLQQFNVEAAKTNNLAELFTANCELTPDVKVHVDAISDITDKLEVDEKRTIRSVLKDGQFEYKHMSTAEFLIEVPTKKVKQIPDSWVLVSRTSSKARYHTPGIIEAIESIKYHRELLTTLTKGLWKNLLKIFAEHYPTLRQLVDQLAKLDCVYAIATLSDDPTYCRPTLLPENQPMELHIQQGRHPIVEKLITNQYIANDMHLKHDGVRAMILTGPNMGGKSSFIKSVALISLMAQMGCYIPAESASLSVLDNLFTRMGAADDIATGRSTFFVECTEASHILNQATDKTLVILDELGRGTSTHDGTAIAHATLEHLIRESKAFTLFVTHYPEISLLAKTYPDHVDNFHMGYQEKSNNHIIFLYRLVHGTATQSYGINVARLAHLPPALVEQASIQSNRMKQATLEGLQQHVLQRISSMLGQGQLPMDTLQSCQHELSLYRSLLP